jgi:hypothetical protein
MIIERIVGVCRVSKIKKNKTGFQPVPLPFFYLLSVRKSLPSSTALRVKGATEKKGRDLLKEREGIQFHIYIRFHLKYIYPQASSRLNSFFYYLLVCG